ncbi:MAG TPA: tyrosine-protein phosphatase [Candidatus Limnocylindrales bacterium]
MTTSRRAAPPERRLRIPGTRNLRDVGGYPAADGRRTRWRTLLRTDALDQLPDASQQMLIDLGLRQVIDLRWPHELADWPSVFAASTRVRYRSVPLLNNEVVDGGMAATYRHMLDNRAAQLAAIARAILEPDGVPAVIGCAAGIDRTGVTIAILLSAVGVPADVVAADYALSVDSYADESSASAMTDWRSGPVSLDCRPEYMQTALEHLERKHGGARALLERHGLTAAELDRLTAVLTEPVEAATGDVALRGRGSTSDLAVARGAS